jgi:hypothetical protein
MLAAGSLRQRLAQTLNAAYGDGLLSEGTLAYRLDVLLRSPVVDPVSVVGDLTFRRRRHALARTIDAARRVVRPSPEAPVLALDWSGTRTELLVGRNPACDVVLDDLSVSRRHAVLRYRDGSWILRDLESTNGTRVNGCDVVRCRVEPGDLLMLGDASLLVD